MMNNKEKSIQILTKGIKFLFKKNKVTHLKGKGFISSKNIVTVIDSSKKKTSYKACSRKRHSIIFRPHFIFY